MTVIETEIARLNARVAHLEVAVRRLGGQPTTEDRPGQTMPGDVDDIAHWLETVGIGRDPTDEERACAAEWDRLSEIEREAHVRRMEALTLEPALSEVIMDSRR